MQITNDYMNTNKGIALRFFVGGILSTLALAAIFFASYAYSEITGRLDTPQDKYETYSFLVSTTTSATSTAYTPAYPIAAAKKINAFFSRGNVGVGNAGASKFSIEVSPDGTTWYDFNRLLGSDVSETATSSVTVPAGTSTVMVAMDLDNSAFQYMRCIVEEITDGSHSCTVSAQW